MQPKYAVMCPFYSPNVINLKTTDPLWRCQSMLCSLGRDGMAHEYHSLTRRTRQREEEKKLRVAVCNSIHSEHGRELTEEAWDHCPLVWAESQTLSLVKISCRQSVLVWTASDRYPRASRLRRDYKNKTRTKLFLASCCSRVRFIYLLCWISKLNLNIYPKRIQGQTKYIHKQTSITTGVPM